MSSLRQPCAEIVSAYDATLTEVWDWSSAVTQSPRAAGKLAPGHTHEGALGWLWGVPGCTCQPEPGALLILPRVLGEASAIYTSGRTSPHRSPEGMPAPSVRPLIIAHKPAPPSRLRRFDSGQDSGYIAANACSAFPSSRAYQGIVSKRMGSRYRSGRSPDWLKFKNPEAPPAVKREADKDWAK
jgi:hypothetical protein